MTTLRLFVFVSVGIWDCWDYANISGVAQHVSDSSKSSCVHMNKIEITATKQPDLLNYAVRRQLGGQQEQKEHMLFVSCHCWPSAVKLDSTLYPSNLSNTAKIIICQQHQTSADCFSLESCTHPHTVILFLSDLCFKNTHTCLKLCFRPTGLCADCRKHAW